MNNENISINYFPAQLSTSIVKGFLLNRSVYMCIHFSIHFSSTNISFSLILKIFILFLTFLMQLLFDLMFHEYDGICMSSGYNLKKYIYKYFEFCKYKSQR